MLPLFTPGPFRMPAGRELCSWQFSSQQSRLFSLFCCHPRRASLPRVGVCYARYICFPCSRTHSDLQVYHFNWYTPSCCIGSIDDSANLRRYFNSGFRYSSCKLNSDNGWSQRQLLTCSFTGDYGISLYVCEEWRVIPGRADKLDPVSTGCE